MVAVSRPQSRIVVQRGVRLPVVRHASTRRIQVNTRRTTNVFTQGGAGYIHTQAVASDDWSVSHNLGYKPVVSVLSPGGVEVDASVLHLSDNQFKVQFNQPQTGQAVAR